MFVIEDRIRALVQMDESLGRPNAHGDRYLAFEAAHDAGDLNEAGLCAGETIFEDRHEVGHDEAAGGAFEYIFEDRGVFDVAPLGGFHAGSLYGAVSAVRVVEDRIKAWRTIEVGGAEPVYPCLPVNERHRACIADNAVVANRLETVAVLHDGLDAEKVANMRGSAEPAWDFSYQQNHLKICSHDAGFRRLWDELGYGEVEHRLNLATDVLFVRRITIFNIREGRFAL
jgi:hypothetical protein